MFVEKCLSLFQATVKGKTNGGRPLRAFPVVIHDNDAYFLSSSMIS